MMRTPRRARRGFTLLELIIAMAIAATIALVLYSTLSTAFKARAVAVGQTASMREAAIALDLIEADLENATPPADASTSSKLFGPMIGEGGGTGANAAGTLSFYTIGRDTQATQTTAASGDNDPLAEGVRQVVFSIGSENGQGVLTRSVQRNVLPSAAAAFEDESLAGDVTGLGFRFYDGASWLDSWNSDDEEFLLPLAVEVSIDLANSDGRGGTKAYHMTRVVPLACANATKLAARGSN